MDMHRRICNSLSIHIYYLMSSLWRIVVCMVFTVWLHQCMHAIVLSVALGSNLWWVVVWVLYLQDKARQGLFRRWGVSSGRRASLCYVTDRRSADALDNSHGHGATGPPRMYVILCIFVWRYIFVCVVMESSGGFVARLVCVTFQPVVVTCGWFLLVQELNNKPLGFVSAQGCY